MTYRGGSYLFGQYGVCALCCVGCPFGGSIAPSQHDIWWGELPFWAIWSMCLVLCWVPIWRVHRSKPRPPMDLILCKPLLHTPYNQLQAQPSWREACVTIPKRCVGSKVCVLQFSIFSCAHLESSARNLSKRPKWSTYVESKVIGVKSLCLEGLVDCTIQAKDTII